MCHNSNLTKEELIEGIKKQRGDMCRLDLESSADEKSCVAVLSLPLAEYHLSSRDDGSWFISGGPIDAASLAVTGRRPEDGEMTLTTTEVDRADESPKAKDEGRSGSKKRMTTREKDLLRAILQRRVNRIAVNVRLDPPETQFWAWMTDPVMSSITRPAPEFNGDSSWSKHEDSGGAVFGIGVDKRGIHIGFRITVKENAGFGPAEKNVEAVINMRVEGTEGWDRDEDNFHYNIDGLDYVLDELLESEEAVDDEI